MHDVFEQKPQRKLLSSSQDSPAALLLVHIEDERLFGETEFVLSLSSVVIQSFDRALKHAGDTAFQ